MAFVMRLFDPETGTPASELYIESGDIKRALDSSEEFNVSVPSNTAAAVNLVEGLIVELYLNGSFLMRGEIQAPDRGVMDVEKSIKVKGRGVLDNLYDVNPDPTLIVENVSMLQLLHNMLEATNWRLGDISTLPDMDFIVESIDLRNETSFLDQFKKVLELQAGASITVGELILDKWSLNIGTFDVDSGAKFRSPGDRFYSELPQHFNIISSLSEKVINTDLIYYLEAEGGEVKDSFDVNRLITLYDAWDNDNDLMTDPEFPIIEIVPGQRYAVVNLEKMPYPGGLFYTVNEAATIDKRFIGDYGSGSRKAWSGFSFRAIPGKLNYISVLLSAVTAGFYADWAGEPITAWISELGTPAAYTYDHYNATRLLTLEDIHPEGLPPLGEFRLDVADYDIFLDYDKVYGVAFGFETGIDNGDYISHLRFNAITGTAIGMGHNRTDHVSGVETAWLDINQFSPMRVLTDPANVDARRFQDSKKWNQYAPLKDGENSSTLVETRAAGAALYSRTVAELRQSAVIQKKYAMSAVGRNLIIDLGNRASVLGKSQTATQNPVSEAITPSYYQVDEDLRVVKYTLSVKSDEVSAKYELSDSFVVEDEGITDLYDKASTTVQKDNKVYSYAGDSKIVQTNIALSSSVPDTTLEDGRAALLVEFPYVRPTDRHSSDFVGLPFPLVADGTVDVEIVSAPNDYTETGLICKVSDGTGWTIQSSMTLSVYIIWR